MMIIVEVPLLSNLVVADPVSPMSLPNMTDCRHQLSYDVVSFSVTVGFYQLGPDETSQLSFVENYHCVFSPDSYTPPMI